MSLKLFFFKLSLSLLLVSNLLHAEESGALSKLDQIKNAISAEFGDKNREINQTNSSTHAQEKNSTNPDTPQIISAASANKKTELLEKIEKLDQEISKDNIWAKMYSNYRLYQRLLEEEKAIDLKIALLKKKKKPLAKADEELLLKYKTEMNTISGKLRLLEEYKDDPFKEILQPKSTEEIPGVSNPIHIVTALSFKKRMLDEQEEYSERFESLKEIVDKLKTQKLIVTDLLKLDENSSEYKKQFEEIDLKLKTYIPLVEIFETTKNVYNKKVEEIKIKLSGEIKNEIEKTFTIGGILLFFFMLYLLTKFIAYRYLVDDDRLYTINKVLNILLVTLLVIVLLFSYIENVDYLVTVLGFASAGIAIAMKDWFMNILGWFVIIIGGTFHVGDRVKVSRNGLEFVGDIVDISLMRLTLHEDVTLTTYMLNRRAGRIIFIPNNYIFTDMIANYTHSGLKTVWDGIDLMITFDSDISRAVSIAKDVSKKYSKGYTDITRKQLNKLRSQYSIRNTNVEPRIFTLIEPYGVKLSVWYLTNSYATLTLRSTISQEIIERINAEKSVSLALPSQSLFMEMGIQRPHFPPEEPIPTQEDLS